MDRRRTLRLATGLLAGSVGCVGSLSRDDQPVRPWHRRVLYAPSSRVVHDGAIWTATRRTRNDEPGQHFSGPWAYLRPTRPMDDTSRASAATDAEDQQRPVGRQRPVDRHGQLQVIGTDLCNAAGEPVQLRGMSSHGLQWFGWGECLTPNSLDVLATDWRADCCRLAIYVQEGGYETDPEGFLAEVHRLIEALSARGLYVIIDFHIREPGDPMANLDHAQRFFDAVAEAHADKPNLIYEICNEPNGVAWDRINAYAERVIPVIRRHDPASPVVVGTPGWSSLGFAEVGTGGPREIIDNPVSAADVLYAYHFYAATHGVWERSQLAAAATELPLFVTECGSMRADGDGPNDFESTAAFFDILDRHTISWAFWSYADDWRTSGVWTEGAAERDSWTVSELTDTGRWIRRRLRGEE